VRAAAVAAFATPRSRIDRIVSASSVPSLKLQHHPMYLLSFMFSILSRVFFNLQLSVCLSPMLCTCPSYTRILFFVGKCGRTRFARENCVCAHSHPVIHRKFYCCIFEENKMFLGTQLTTNCLRIYAPHSLRTSRRHFKSQTSLTKAYGNDGCHRRSFIHWRLGVCK
jgi:hypothetical protein